MITTVPDEAFILAGELHLLFDRGDTVLDLGLKKRDRTQCEWNKASSEWKLFRALLIFGKIINADLYEVTFHDNSEISILCDGNEIVMKS